MLFNLPRTYWLLWFGTFLNRLGAFVLPFLTFYLTSKLGIPPAQATLGIALFGAGSFLAQLTGGELTDRLGRRPVMLISFLVTPLVMTALGFLRELPQIVACTFILGFITDLSRPAISAAVADLVPSEDRPRAFGYLYWAINLGFAAAPVLAGFLAGYNYLYLFLGDAFTTLLFGLIVLFGVSETRPVEAAHAAHATLSGRVAQLRRAPILLLFSFLTLFLAMIYMQGYVTLPLAMLSAGFSPTQYGTAIAMNGVLIVFLNLPFSSAVGKLPRFPAVAASVFLLGLGFGFTAFAHTLTMFIISIVIWTFGEMFGTAVAPAIIADLAPIDQRGLFQGVFGAAWGLAAFLGPLVGGFVYERFGADTLWGGCFALGCALALSYLALGRAVHKSAAASVTGA